MEGQQLHVNVNNSNGKTFPAMLPVTIVPGMVRTIFLSAAAECKGIPITVFPTRHGSNGVRVFVFHFNATAECTPFS